MVFLEDITYSLVQILLVQDVSFSHNTLHHTQTDRRYYANNSWSYCVQE